MENKKYLNEEKYQKTSKKLFLVGVAIIILGLVVAAIMIITKLDFGKKASKEELQQQLTQLKPALQERYNELETKGVKESWDYKNQEGYEMALIDIALDPTYSTCESSSIYSDHDTTREYCKVKSEIYEFDSSKINGGILFTIVPSLMILMPCLGIGAMLILTSKRREIAAFSVQQVMPIAKEGIDEMTPTVGKAAKDIINEMTPIYGNVAKEIAKGIKEGMKDEEK